MNFTDFTAQRKKKNKKIKQKQMGDRLKHPGKCTHCGGDPELKKTSEHVNHGIDRGPIWECKCSSRVYCHPGTTLPLGKVASQRERQFRHWAHESFDLLWIPRSSCRKFIDRIGAYQWLAAKMGLKVNDCHIGLMNVEQCKMVIKFCEEFKK